MDKETQANLITQLKDHPGYKLLDTMMQSQFEAYKNELENPASNVPYLQGRIATYRDIFNYIDEKIKKL